MSLGDRQSVVAPETKADAGMPLRLQAKLLRLVEDGIVRPVGSDRANKVDARVIAASNSDLAAGVRRVPSARTCSIACR